MVPLLIGTSLPTLPNVLYTEIIKKEPFTVGLNLSSCGQRYAGQRGWLLLLKRDTIISQGHTVPHLPHKSMYTVLSANTHTRAILRSSITHPRPPAGGNTKRMMSVDLNTAAARRRSYHRRWGLNMHTAKFSLTFFHRTFIPVH